MGATASLSGTALAVEPGESVDCELQVRNTGRVVDQFTFEVLGDAAPWATVEPESLSLFPDGDGTARVTFAPPRLPQTPAGAVPFAVKVVSHEDPDGTVAEEGVLEVGGFADATAELIPRTSRGRRGGRHDLAFDNRGNQLVDAQLLASDPDNLLTFELAPASLVAEPGTAVFSKVRVRPKHRLWRGQPASHPFQVLVEPQHGVPLAVDGTYLQEPVIPRWLPRALLALLALLLLLVALWFALLRPVVRSAARDAVAEEVAQAEQAAAEDAAAAEEAAAQAGQAAKEAGAGGQAAQQAATGAQQSAEQVQQVAQDVEEPLGDPFDFRLAAVVAPGAEGSANFTVPAGQRLALTDIVLQNPQGNRGALQIKRGDAGILLEVRLENFRDLDYHFVAPILFQERQQVVLTVRCENAPPAPNAPAGPCNPASYFSGFIKVPPPPPPAPARNS